MKTFDYSPINEDKFIIVNYLNNGSFKLYIDGLLQYNSESALDINFTHVAFSYNGTNIIFREDSYTHNTLTITSLNSILQNSIEPDSLFKFRADQILDYVVSTNSDQVAILFKSVNNYMNTISGVNNISEVNQNKYFLQVYDFTNNTLLLEKIYERYVKFSISELNTISVTTHIVDDDEVVNSFEIAVFDLVTGNRLNNKFYDYQIQFIQYFPEIESYYNKLLVITKENDNTRNIKILDLEDNFRLLNNINIDGYNVNTVQISQYGQIAIGTHAGLIYLQTFEDDPVVLFRDLDNTDITSVTFSQSANKIKFACSYFGQITGDEYLDIHHYNFVDPEDDIPIEDLSQNEPIRIVEEEEEELFINPPGLNSCYIPTTNPDKLQLYGDKTCFDIFQMSEENIGQYLSADNDNIVIFYKQVDESDFLATCLTFTGLKKYIQDPKHAFYRCVKGKDYRTYIDDQPDFLKIPTQSITIFVSYEDIKQKYIQRQNMIFLEYSERVDTTITYEAIVTNNFISSNHCQDGSLINVYHIIF
jgi:hypothetical protein